VYSVCVVGFQVSLVLFRASDEAHAMSRWNLVLKRLARMEQMHEKNGIGSMRELGALISSHCREGRKKSGDDGIGGALQTRVLTKTDDDVGCIGCASRAQSCNSPEKAKVVGITLTIKPIGTDQARWDRVLGEVARRASTLMMSGPRSVNALVQTMRHVTRHVRGNPDVKMSLTVRYSEGTPGTCKCSGGKCSCATRYRGLCPCGVSGICGCTGGGSTS